MNNPTSEVKFDKAEFFLQYPPPDTPDVDWELVCPTTKGDYYIEMAGGKWVEQKTVRPEFRLGLRAIPRQRKAVFTENPCFRCEHCRIRCFLGNTLATCSIIPPDLSAKDILVLLFTGKL